MWPSIGKIHTKFSGLENIVITALGFLADANLRHLTFDEQMAQVLTQS